jgi:hypothetical protein
MSPTDQRASLAKVRNEADFILLRLIGKISVRHHFQFGRKKVQRAIDESSLDKEYDGSDLRAIKSEVRRAFGVHGRKGRKARRVIPPAGNIAIGTTEEGNSVVEALCDGGAHVE